jgi:putative nucleotidyltransferase with HDIG domain
VVVRLLARIFNRTQSQAPEEKRNAEPLSPAARLYIVALWALAICLTITNMQGLRQARWTDLLVLFGATVLAETWFVTTSPESGMSLSFTMHYAAAVLFGPAFAAVIAATSLLCADGVIRHRPVRQTIFNAASFAVSAAICGIVFQHLSSGNPIDLKRDAFPLVAAALAYLVVNDTLVAVIITLMGGPFLHEWLSSFRDIGVPYVSMAPLGALVAYAYQSSPWTLLYFPPLVLVIYNGFKLFVTLQHETDHALVALADSIDKRDQYTYQHSVRVARYAGEIARSTGLPPREIELIISAARVHDLGKIATDNRVLFKRSSLTEEERRLINAHPAEGGELAGKFSMFRKGRSFIRHHHERWDGKGYPDGLAGDEIPLGARIIAVADAYDAMTSDRPYRQALSHDIAIAELQRGAGKQFDPNVVAAFIAPEHHSSPRVSATSTAQQSCSYS